MVVPRLVNLRERARSYDKINISRGASRYHPVRRRGCHLLERLLLLDKSTTVSNASTRSLLRLCDARGLDVSAMLGDANVSPDRLAAPIHRLEYSQMVHIWNAAAMHLHDEALGLHVAQLTPLGAYGALDYLILTSATVGEAYAKAAKYFQLGNGGAELRSYRKKDETWIELYSPDTPLEHLPRSAQYTFAILVSRLGAACGTSIRPRAAEFTFATPKTPLPLAEAFGPSMIFGKPYNRLLLDDSLLGLHCVQHDPALNELIEFQVARTLAGLGVRDSFVEQCRSLILTSLPGRKHEIDSIAQQMCVSVRTLQRRLAEEGTSFRDLLDGVRLARAGELFATGVTDPRAIASDLGYSNARTLHRALRRWTGTTPFQPTDGVSSEDIGA